jgi:cytochrome c556
MKHLTIAITLSAALLLPAVAAEDPAPEHVKWMKESQELQGKIRKNVDVEAAGKRYAALYEEVGKFWAPRSETGAKATKDVREGGAALAKAAAAGDAEAVTAAARAIGGGCRSCHDAHREKVSDGVFKIR